MHRHLLTLSCTPRAHAGKAEAIVDRMVEGRLSKFYGEHCLLEQPFIMDNALKVRGRPCVTHDTPLAALPLAAAVWRSCSHILTQAWRRCWY